jgi:hypothetical protein
MVPWEMTLRTLRTYSLDSGSIVPSGQDLVAATEAETCEVNISTTVTESTPDKGSTSGNNGLNAGEMRIRYHRTFERGTLNHVVM